jgi:hypothetical protein
MSYISLAIFPNTVERKSSVPSDGRRGYSTRFSALILRLDIDHPKDKHLGVELSDYVGSWCSVYVGNENDGPFDPRYNQPQGTCAILTHNPDGDGGSHRDDVPDWRFGVILALTETDHLAFQFAMNQRPCSIVLECHDWTNGPEALKFSSAPAVWQARFTSFELKYHATPADQPFYVLPAVAELFEPFWQTKEQQKTESAIFRESSHCISRSITQWAVAAPVKRNKVLQESQDAVQLLERLVDYSSVEVLESATSEYLKKPWADCARFELALFTTLAADRVTRLIEELNTGEPYIDANVLRAHYGISYKARAPSKKHLLGTGIWNSIWGIGAGVAVGIGAGWAAGLAVGLVVLLLQRILFELGKNKSETVVSDSALIHDLESAKNYGAGSWWTPCPRAIRETFERLQGRGVRWHPGTLELVRHAEARNPHRWE